MVLSSVWMVKLAVGLFLKTLAFPGVRFVGLVLVGAGIVAVNRRVLLVAKAFGVRVEDRFGIVVRRRGFVFVRPAVSGSIFITAAVGVVVAPLLACRRAGALLGITAVRYGRRLVLAENVVIDLLIPEVIDVSGSGVPLRNADMVGLAGKTVAGTRRRVDVFTGVLHASR